MSVGGPFKPGGRSVKLDPADSAKKAADAAVTDKAQLADKARLSDKAAFASKTLVNKLSADSFESAKATKHNPFADKASPQAGGDWKSGGLALGGDEAGTLKGLRDPADAGGGSLKVGTLLGGVGPESPVRIDGLVERAGDGSVRPESKEAKGFGALGDGSAAKSWKYDEGAGAIGESAANQASKDAQGFGASKEAKGFGALGDGSVRQASEEAEAFGASKEAKGFGALGDGSVRQASKEAKGFGASKEAKGFGALDDKARLGDKARLEATPQGKASLPAELAVEDTQLGVAKKLDLGDEAALRNKLDPDKRF